jgi:AcrR family transcriptional regulator
MTTSPSDRRRQILDTALASFSAAGYHNTSMNDIAEALSMTKPVVYQYFDSKRALYLELLRFVGDDLVTTVASSVAGADNPQAQTEQGMIAYFTWVANNKQAFALLYESSARVDAEFTDLVSRQVLRHGRDFDPEALGRAVASLAWGGLRLIGQPNTQ